MTNYDLEEAELIKKQMGLSALFLLTLIVSLSLSYNELLKHQKQQPLYTKDAEESVLVINRILAFLIAFGFLLINIKDKKIKQNYNQGNMKIADLQIDASVITLIATIIVLYVAVSGRNGSTEIENPEV